MLGHLLDQVAIKVIKRVQARDRLQEVKALLRLEARYVQKLADFADSLIRIMSLIYTITGKQNPRISKNSSGVYMISFRRQTILQIIFFFEIGMKLMMT